jgi:hypothetical protein
VETINRERIYREIDRERERQDELHGRDLGGDALAILGEEYGEVCRAIFEKDEVNLDLELIQVAAVAVKWLEERGV